MRNQITIFRRNRRGTLVRLTKDRSGIRAKRSLWTVLAILIFGGNLSFGQIQNAGKEVGSSKPSSLPKEILAKPGDPNESIVAIAIDENGVPVRNTIFQIQTLNRFRKDKRNPYLFPIFRSKAKVNGMIQLTNLPKNKKWFLVAEARGYTRVVQSISNPKNPLIFHLRKSKTITATIVDSKSRPIKGVQITEIRPVKNHPRYYPVIYQMRNLLDSDKPYVSDEKGFCNIPDLDINGTFLIQFRHSLYATEKIRVDVSKKKHLQITMKKLKNIYVNVTDDDGNPVLKEGEWLRLLLWPEKGILESEPHQFVYPLPEFIVRNFGNQIKVSIPPQKYGRFKLTLPSRFEPAGELVSKAVATRYRNRFKVQDLDLTQSDVTVYLVARRKPARNHTLKGRITFQDGSPGSRLSFQLAKSSKRKGAKKARWVEIQSVIADQNGDFSINVEHGTYRISFRHHSKFFTPKDQQIVISPNQSDTRHDISIKATIVSGRVVNTDLKPIPNALITAISNKSIKSRRYWRTDDQGNFHINLGRRQFSETPWLAVSPNGKLAGFIQPDVLSGSETNGITFVCLKQEPFLFEKWINVEKQFPNLQKEYIAFVERRKKELSKLAVRAIRNSRELKDEKGHKIPKSTFVLYHFVDNNGMKSVNNRSRSLNKLFHSYDLKQVVFLNKRTVLDNPRIELQKRFHSQVVVSKHREPSALWSNERKTRSPCCLLFFKDLKWNHPICFFFDSLTEVEKKIRKLVEEENQSLLIKSS